MKIEINIDVEAIVRDAINSYVRENITINNVAGAPTQVTTDTAEDPSSVVVTLKSAVPSVQTATAIWEYAPKLGRRRNKTEIALHEKELELGRILTPEEKGQIDATVELADESEAKAKAETKQKARIDEMTAEATEAATKELAEEAETASEDAPSALFDEPEDDGIEDTIMPGETAEETIPKADDLKLNSLFS
jgi:hypothetical protein